MPVTWSDEKLILLYCPGRGSNSRPSAHRGFKHGQGVPRPYSLGHGGSKVYNLRCESCAHNNVHNATRTLDKNKFTLPVDKKIFRIKLTWWKILLILFVMVDDVVTINVCLQTAAVSDHYPVELRIRTDSPRVGMSTTRDAAKSSAASCVHAGILHDILAHFLWLARHTVDQVSFKNRSRLIIFVWVKFYFNETSSII